MCDRREYGLLSKRSKQILGEEVQVKDDAQSADAAPSEEASTYPQGCKRTSGAITDADADAEQKQKRRSQVLRAQRTHRQRTQTYIKMLEREVLRLRDSERSALHKVDNLQKQVDELLRILVRSNTPPISATSDEAQEGQGDNHQNHETNKTHHHRQGSRSTVTTRFEGNRGVFVDVQFPTNTDVSESTELPGLVRHGHQHDQNSKETRLEYHSQYSSPLSNTSDASPNSNGVRLAELHTPSSTSQDEALWPGFQTKPAAPDDALLSDPRRGIEFVLTLETDCMDHLRGKHLDHVHESGHNHNEKDISGHVTTASLSLWQQHTATLSLSANATFQISNAELERLLSSSLNLGLMSPEITPVQIWNRIRWIPLPGGEQALQRLTRELKKNVFCVGFGAVLHDEVVEDILQQYFSDLPPHHP